MQRRLIEELAALRGGKTRLRVLREEYQERHGDLVNELDEVEGILDLITKVTEEEGNGKLEVTTEVTSKAPVDSLGE